MPSKMRFFVTACCLLVVLFSVSSAKTLGHKKAVRERRSVAKAPLAPAAKAAVPEKPGQNALDLAYLPQNTAVYAGSKTTFSCRVDPDVPTVPRVQWMEYAYLSDGQLISENEVVLGHPQAARYSINATEPNQYDLIISDIVLADGGIYTCSDLGASVPQKQRAAAQLVVIGGFQNCTTTVPDQGHVVEGFYYTHECTVDFKGNILPLMTWTGPAPFNSGQSNTSTRIWSGLSFTADRTMTSQHFISSLNFTGNFFPVPIDTADNVPDFKEDYITDRMTVNWPPRDLYADPVKPLNEYQVGDIIYCFADAFPSAEFTWTNVRTAEVIFNQAFEVQPSWQGFDQTMRCTASNSFNGNIFSNDLFIPLSVPFPPTTTVPTTTQPTTPPPAVSDCLDMTGRWTSVQPVYGDLCIAVNATNGAFYGGFRNGTDTFWSLTSGNTHLPQNEHIAFSIIWPDNVAVSSMIGECSRCFGQEVLLVSAITRSKGMVTCGVPGAIRYSDEYTFIRSNQPCPGFKPQ